MFWDRTMWDCRHCDAAVLLLTVCWKMGVSCRSQNTGSFPILKSSCSCWLKVTPALPWVPELLQYTPSHCGLGSEGELTDQARLYIIEVSGYDAASERPGEALGHMYQVVIFLLTSQREWACPNQFM